MATERADPPELKPNPTYNRDRLEAKVAENKLTARHKLERLLREVTDPRWQEMLRHALESWKKEMDLPTKWEDLTNLNTELPGTDERDKALAGEGASFYKKLYEDMDKFLNDNHIYAQVSQLHKREIELLVLLHDRGGKSEGLTSKERDELSQIQDRLFAVTLELFIYLRRLGYSYGDLRRTGSKSK